MLASLARMRDVALVFATITYVFGFVCFSIASYRFSFGFFKPFDAQYFVAGLVPVSIAFALAYILLRGADLRARATEFFERLYSSNLLSRILSRFRGTLFSIILYGPAALCYQYILALDDEVSLFVSLLFYGAAVLGILVSYIFGFLSVRVSSIWNFLKDDSLWSPRNWKQVLFLPLKIFGIVLGALATLAVSLFIRFAFIAYLILAVFYYGWITYPLVPQEFGGLKPKCAIVLMDSAKVPSQFMDAERPFLKEADKSILQIKVEVLLYSSDRILLRTQRSSPMGVVEVKAVHISAIRWC